MRWYASPHRVKPNSLPRECGYSQRCPSGGMQRMWQRCQSAPFKLGQNTCLWKLLTQIISSCDVARPHQAALRRNPHSKGRRHPTNNKQGVRPTANHQMIGTPDKMLQPKPALPITATACSHIRHLEPEPPGSLTLPLLTQGNCEVINVYCMKSLRCRDYFFM